MYISHQEMYISLSYTLSYEANNNLFTPFSKFQKTVHRSFTNFDSPNPTD